MIFATHTPEGKLKTPSDASVHVRAPSPSPLHQHELSLQCPQALLCCRRYKFLRPSVDQLEQLLYSVAADTGDHTKLGQVSADRIDQRRTLAHERLPGPMQHQHRLLLLRLDFNQSAWSGASPPHRS